MLSEKTLDYLIIIFSALLVCVFIFRFIIKDNQKSFSINVAKITISRLDGTQIKLVDMVKNKDEAYILLFRLNDCYSCITKGLSDLQNLSKSGYECIAIVIHDCLPDVKGFAEMFSGISFHQLTIKEQYEYIHSPYFPVILSLKNKRVVNYRFITL
ncbi:MAG: hypothetical protein H5U06_04185 [Candidatus Aminicenantes bacterium]|nr:hypothetical protein [Candidatus Aminicenantes bacterium]